MWCDRIIHIYIYHKYIPLNPQTHEQNQGFFKCPQDMGVITPAGWTEDWTSSGAGSLAESLGRLARKRLLKAGFYLRIAFYMGFTPWKINMDPTNNP